MTRGIVRIAESLHDALCSLQSIQQSPNGNPVQGMDGAGSDLRQGYENEAPSVRFGMGDDQAGLRKDRLAVKNKIQIDHSGSPPHIPPPAHGIFDAEQDIQKLTGRKKRSNLHGGVDEPVLIRHAHRLGAIER